MNIVKTLAVGTFLASTLAATGAFAKAHDQGNTAVPGENVKTETVAAAQTLGERLGDARGFARLSGKMPGKSDPGGMTKDDAEE